LPPCQHPKTKPSEEKHRNDIEIELYDDISYEELCENLKDFSEILKREKLNDLLFEEFSKKGYKSAVITANTSSNERSEILEKF